MERAGREESAAASSDLLAGRRIHWYACRSPFQETSPKFACDIRSNTLYSPASDSLSRSALILYGSETGNAQDVAEEIGRLTERLHFDSTILDLDSVQLRDVVKPTVVIFVISTAGQGEMPQNARAFWKTLLSSALRPGILRKLRFSSFGLGDSSYAHFNVAHRMLHGRLLQLGAQTFCERGEGNEQHPEGHSAGFREWIVPLQQKVLETFPLPDGLEPVTDDVFIEPKWKLEAAFSAACHATNGTHEHEPEADSPPSPKADSLPSPDLLPLVGGYTAEIVHNDRVTATDHFQDVRLLDLHLQASVPYGPGAVAVIHPKNFPADVSEFIRLMDWTSIAHTPLNLISTTPPKLLSTPSPLRNFDLSNTTLTLHYLLTNILDIMSIPRRSFFASLLHFAGSSTEDEIYQKDRLIELANPELIDELWDYTTRPKRTIIEVLMDFTTLKIPLQYLLEVVPVMRGRQFSIASGGALTKNPDGMTRLQLLIAIADPPSPIIKWRRRYGVCTRYIATLREQQQICVKVEPGYLDVRRVESVAPVVLVGPGTGVAPLRALVHQRVAWAKEGTPHGDVLLFFGCRSAETDFFFKEEWAELVAADERLQVFPAFSRPKGGKTRQYVQELMRAEGAKVVDALVRKNGKIYVCGSSGAMPKGVREALVDVMVREKGMEREAAEVYLEGMEKSGRYLQETW